MASNETITLPQSPKSTPSHIPLDIGAPKIVIIRATSESCDPVRSPNNMATAENAHSEPHAPILPSSVEDPFEDPAESIRSNAAAILLPSSATQSSAGTALVPEELGQIEVPVQGMIPAGTRFIRKARCVLLRGPVLTIILGRELAKQTQPVLKLMAHGVAVQTNAEGKLELQPSASAPMTIFDVHPTVSKEAKAKTTVLPDPLPGSLENPGLDHYSKGMCRNPDLGEREVHQKVSSIHQSNGAGANTGPSRTDGGYEDPVHELSTRKIADDASLVGRDPGNE